MATAFAGEAAHVKDIGHLSAPDIARATGADETTVRAWLRGTRSPSGARAERLAELSAIVERLVRVMDPTYVPVWLRKPIALLDDDKPLDVIATGDYRRVSRVLAGLEATGAVQPLDVDPTAVAGTWFRHVPSGTGVQLQPPHPADNRWQRGEVVDALYFADSEETVWAEWYRFLAEAGLPPKQGLPRDLWRWKIALPEVADLGDEGRLARVGLPPLRPTRAQWPAFQVVGEQLFADGWPALVSASAARPAGMTLCVFRTSRRVAGTWPIRPPTRVGEPPVVPSGLRT